MLSKKQKLTKKVTLLIIFSCAACLGISAQKTQLQIDIDNTALNGTVQRGTIEWYVVKKTTDINGISYAFLISKTYLLNYPVQFNSSGSSDYQNSDLQTNLYDYYRTTSGNFSELWDIAVVPKLGTYSDQNAISEPTATLAGNQKNDILFAPSYRDVYNWNGNSNSIGYPLSDYPFRWWTRTPSPTVSGNVWIVFSTAGVITDAVQAFGTGNIYGVGGIWVRTSPLYFTISGTVNGAPNNEGIEISYSIGGVAQTPVTSTTGGTYVIPQIPLRSNVVITPQTIPGYEWYVSPTPDISNVTTDIANKFITYYISGFTVNDENYTDVDGKGYCNNSFTLKADPNIPAEIVWSLDGTEIPSTRGLSSFMQNLQNGYHTIAMTVPALGKIYTTHLYVGDFSVIWTPESNSAGTEDEKRDWNIAANWTPAVVPTSCDTVFIPGNLDYYPILEEANPAQCLDIYFMYGAELGRPDLLTYQRAFVQYNFGLSQSTQETGYGQDRVLESSSTDNRLLYSASVSAPPINRERWYMLSAPLRNVVTGDLDFGGFPLTFLKKFGPVNKNNIQYLVGEWTTPYNSMDELVSPTGTEGFAFYMYGYLDGGSATRNASCLETGVFGDYNEDDYMLNRNGKNYGIKQTNGILELPFFADSTNLYAHRTQVYNQPMSTFYYISDGVNYQPDFNMLTGTTESVAREENNGNYRFAPESYINHEWAFQNPIIHLTTDLNAGDEFLVGNPYMSSIDMAEFCKENPSVEPSFRIWNGKDFDTYSVDISTGQVTPTKLGTSPYISPLQGFFLKYTGSGDVSFDVEKISTVRQTLAFNLRSSQDNEEKNILRIKAENSYSASYAVIGYKNGASNGYNPHEDVQKLFSPFDYVPSIYSLADETPVDFNFINDSGNITIPLGIKTGQTGEISLTFTGMDNYSKASRIELIDALENKTVDLTGESSYTRSFNNTETGILNGRFSLRISTSTTSLPDINSSDNLNVYENSKGIYVVSSEPVQKLEIYDFTGKKLYETNSDTKYYPLQDNLVNSPLIVRVITKDNAKTIKIN